jgi:hypothetical protein
MGGGSVGAFAPRLYQETDHTWNAHFLSVSLTTKFPLQRPLDFPIPMTVHVHDHLEEKASEDLSIKILHRETGDKIFGEHCGATTRFHSWSSSLIYILLFRLGDFDLHHGR